MPFNKNNTRVPTVIERLFRYVSKDSNGCWIWSGSTAKGYGKMAFWIGPDTNRRRLIKLAHRISWETFKGKIPDGLSVLHKCDVRLCINPSHLFVGTHSDNMRDMYSKGRRPRKRPECVRVTA